MKWIFLALIDPLLLTNSATLHPPILSSFLLHKTQWLGSPSPFLCKLQSHIAAGIASSFALLGSGPPHTPKIIRPQISGACSPATSLHRLPLTRQQSAAVVLGARRGEFPSSFLETALINYSTFLHNISNPWTFLGQTRIIRILLLHNHQQQYQHSTTGNHPQDHNKGHQKLQD